MSNDQSAVDQLIAPLTVDRIENLTFADDLFFIYSNAEDYDRANIPYWEKFSGSLHSHSSAIVETIDGDGRVAIAFDGKTIEFVTGNFSSLRTIVPKDAHVVVDISAIGHEFIASCLLALRGHASGLTYIYTEPRSYRFRSEPSQPDPFDPTMFDLSASIGGIRSLPGFVNLLGPGRMEAIFVPLLGFEGARALNVLNSLDPVPRTIVPVVGVPGYRPEFPSYTIICNRAFFGETRSESKIRRAAANDPFALRRTLRAIQCDYPDHYFYLAPIGTRPHALGALMFAMENPESAEILFDHPTRRERSRVGAGPSHVFRVL